MRDVPGTVSGTGGSPENTRWARTLIDGLATAGLREVVVAPGSRSTPLVMACAADPRLTVRVHLDERSCGFFALGVGLATGSAAAVVTTSGTAVANLMPAVVEASQSGVPLLVLTADRPPRLRGADANQAIDQVGIFGGYPRAFHELAEPSADGRALAHLRAVAARAWSATRGADGGPVHLNIPFDKPLEPLEPLEPTEPAEAVGAGEAGARTGPVSPASSAGPAGSGPRPHVSISEGPRAARVEDIERLHAALSGRAAVLVAGPSRDPGGMGPAVRRLARALGAPLLADPLSGARYGPDDGALVVAGYDLFLTDPGLRERLAPEVVLRVGASPTSASLQRWLFAHSDVPQIVVDDGPRWKDHGATASTYLRADAASTLARVAARVEGAGATGSASTGEGTTEVQPTPEGSSASGSTTREGPVETDRTWRTAHRAALGVLTSGARDALGEGAVAGSVLAALPAGARLVVSSSMPVRDLDAFSVPTSAPVAVHANRGASGIDGVVSTAYGVAAQADGSTALVIGDVAFFHDQNGLLWSREPDAPLVIVVVDNDGGAIFGMLPIAEYEPEFTRFFTTPHGIDPRHAAAAHGLEYRRVEPVGVGDAVAAAAAGDASVLLHVRTDGAAAHAARAALRDRVVTSVRDALA